MPELAEVETTRRGIMAAVCEQKISRVVIRNHQLRWPVPPRLSKALTTNRVTAIERRGKYLLLTLSGGTLIIHLGMSGCLRIINANVVAEKHDHIDIVFENGDCLRYTDPRRFGSFHWTTENPLLHRLLRDLGPEPLTPDFTAKFLLGKALGRSVPVKTFIMNSHVVVGIGNIYATESLFRAGIHPLTPAATLSSTQAKQLVASIKAVLTAAIKQGGTTLRDFLKSDGKPGYFRQHLQVYGKVGEPCGSCQTQLQPLKINQRCTVFCPHCQPLPT